MAGYQILQGQPSFTQGTGVGLSQGLNQLAQQKLQEIQQANEQVKFSRLLQATNRGYNQADADFFASFRPQDRLEAIQSSPRRDEFAPQEQTVSPIGQVLNTQNPESQNQPQAFKVPSDQELDQIIKSSGLNLSPEQQTQMRANLDKLRNNPEEVARLQQQYADDVAQNKPIELRQPGYTGPAVPLEQALAQTQQAAQPRQDLSLRKPGTAASRETTQQKEEIKHAVKQDAEYEKEIVDVDKEANVLLETIDKLEKYVNDSSFLTGFQYALAKNITGLPKANQEFDKLVKESIVQRAQKGGAGRATDQLRKLISETVPNPYENDISGIKGILSLMKDNLQTAKLPANLYYDAKKQYKKLPTGWSSEIQNIVRDIQPIRQNTENNDLQDFLEDPSEWEEGTSFDLGNGHSISKINGKIVEQ